MSRLVPTPLQLLEIVVEGVLSGDEEDEAMLRDIVRKCADAAPVDALIEIGKTLITIRKRDELFEGGEP